ncbi:developmentally-regulated protein [Acrasis kona]|uniref:Developmentally-regulated protein n=1 Tax=Acrasis kona TaxID=1008807 RepID=A0AAW2ZPD7_9EUKA
MFEEIVGHKSFGVYHMMQGFDKDTSTIHAQGACTISEAVTDPIPAYTLSQITRTRNKCLKNPNKYQEQLKQLEELIKQLSL